MSWVQHMYLDYKADGMTRPLADTSLCIAVTIRSSSCTCWKRATASGCRSASQAGALPATTSPNTSAATCVASNDN